MTAPLVSVIIPTYNMRRFIAEAIDSALAQTYPYVEVIVVDDGSTDGTGDYVQERYGERIRYVCQPNQGRGAARNHGLHRAQGEYIQFLDTDDLIYPHKLEGQVAFLQEHPEYAAVYGHCLVAYEDDVEHPWDWSRQSYYVAGDILKQEIHTPFLLTSMILVCKAWVERVGGFDETLRSNEDWDLWLRIAAAGGKFAHLAGDPVAVYRRPRQPRGKPVVHLESGVTVLRKLERSLDGATGRRLHIQRAIGHWLFGYGKALADNGNRLQGLRAMMEGIVLDQRSLTAKLATIGLCFLPLTLEQRETLFRSLRRLKHGR